MLDHGGPAPTVIARNLEIVIGSLILKDARGKNQGAGGAA
jgi:hypothetical protein